MADTTDFKNGLVLKIDNKLMQIVEFQHVKPGKGPAFVRTKLKDVVSGKTVDKTWNAGVKVETATVDRRDMTYLYNDGTSYVVMDEKTFEQYELPPEKFGDAARFLLENMRVQVSFYEDEALFAELPISVDLKVEHTEPGLQVLPAAPSLPPWRPVLKSRFRCSSRSATFSRSTPVPASTSPALTTRASDCV